MKTNTTKLRRALTAFAMTGAMLAISELCPAAEHFSTDTTIEKKNETVDAGGSKYYTADDSVTVKAYFTESTFSNARNDSGTELSGSIISGGNWIVNGGAFTGNSVITVDKATGDMTAKGGAISGGKIDLLNTTFKDNYAKTGSYMDASTDGATITTPYGGAVYGSLVTVSGNSSFTGNYVSSGNPYYNGLTRKANNEALGGAIAGTSGDSNNQANIDAIVIGGTDKDTITFSDNHAYALEETNSKSSSVGGAVGGALGTHVGKVTINAKAGDSITFTDNTAEAKFSRAAGGAIGAGAQDKWGTVEINADKDSTVLFKDNMASSADGAARVMGGAIYSRSDVDVTNVTFDGNKALLKNGNGGDVEVGGGAIYNHKGNTTITDSTFTNNSATGTGALTIATGGAIHSAEASLTLTGTNKFENNFVSNENGAAQGGAIYGNKIEFSGADSKATFTGNKANNTNNDIYVTNLYDNNGNITKTGSLLITNNGTYTFGGGITTDAGGTLTISGGANVTFENGSITDIKGEMTLAGANLTLNIDDATKFTVGSITASDNHQLMVNYDGTNDLVLTTGTVTGLTNAKVNFTNKTFADGELGYLDASNGLVIKTVNMEDGTAGIFNRISSGILTTSETLKGLGTAVDGDQIIVTKNTTLAAGDSIKVPANLTISSNNSTDRTINANGASSIFTTDGTSTLTLENITITGAYKEGNNVTGSVIDGDNWTIIGGEFVDNKTYGIAGGGDHLAYGGAIKAATIDLQNVKFTGNIVKANDEVYNTGANQRTMSMAIGGAVYAQKLTLSGESTFTGNKAISGDVTDTGWNRKDPAIGGAIAVEQGSASVGADGKKDTIVFQGNEAYSGTDKGNTTDLGGSIGGAIGLGDYADLKVKAEKGDSIQFIENKATTEHSRALGGAIGAGRNSYAASVTVEAEEGGEILFQNNTAESTKGTLPVMGGALYSSGNVTANGTVFDGNTAKFNVTDATKDAADSNFDAETLTSVSGGAIAVHNNYNYAGTENLSVAVENSTFTNNSAVVTGSAEGVQANAYGGAISAKGKLQTATVTLSGTNVFENNSASSTAGEAKGGAIYGDTVTFNGDESQSTFVGNTANGVQNDVHAKTAVTINGGTHFFGGGITTDAGGTLDITDANVSFGNNAIVSVGGGTITGSTLDLGKGVKIDSLDSVTVDSLTFNADPTANGFSSISATESFSVNTVDVGLNVFTVGAMDGDTVTLINGGKAGTVKITNGNLMTLTDDTAKTAVKINQDKNGQYGSAPVQEDTRVRIDFGGKDSLEVKDFSLLVDGTDIDLNTFAEWIETKTGLETIVGTGYVNVRLDSPFEIMASDSFIWDFSGYDKAASLQFATVNIMDNAIPEPTTWALLVLGGLGIFGIARKNRKAKK